MSKIADGYRVRPGADKAANKPGSKPRLERSLWTRAFCTASAAMLAAPGVALAQSNQELNAQIQELKSEVQQLKVQQPGTPAAAKPASEETPVTVKGATLNLGGLKLTLGGFLAAESVWRSRNESADINSAYTAYPFKNNNNFYDSEFRESARQSRVQLLAQGPSDGVNKVEGFIAADFLSSGTTSNQNQSNSYTLRLREAYASWARSDYDFYLLAGQSWSLTTLYKKGLNPRAENVPLTIDAQYVPGFNWLRTPELRVVKNFDKLAAVGVSLENPQNLVRGGAPAGALANNPGTGGGLLNATTNYSTDIAPDVTVKVALDPGFGHYEVYSLTRFFRDRAESTPATLASTKNRTTVAESIGGGLIVPVLPKLVDFQASGLIGHGNGRYGTSGLGDSTFNANNGAIAALEEQQFLLGVVAHPTDRLDLYTYAGMEHLGSAYKYGNGNGDNSACNVNVVDTGSLPQVGGIAAGCSAAISTVRQATGGFWWKFYKGPIGYLSTGAQASYTKINTYTDAAGFQGKTNDATVLLSLRYYPYQ